MRTLLLGSCLVLAGCVGTGELDTVLSGQVVGADQRPLGPGLVLIERGPVHAGAYQHGTTITEDGRFETPLGGGGTWGIHLFHDDYQYLPLEVTLGEHQQVALTSLNVTWGVWMDLTGQPTWPAQPDDERLVRLPFDDNPADNPVMSNLRLEHLGGGLLELGGDVHDPDGDMSRMFLVHDEATGGGYALNPPEPPAGGNYPNGHYSLKLYLDERHIPGVSRFSFIVTDNLCNNSPIQTLVLPELE